MPRAWLADDGNIYPVGDFITEKLDAIFGEQWPSLAQTQLIVYLLQRRSEGMRGIALTRHTKLFAWLHGCSGLDVKRAKEHAARVDNLPRHMLRDEITKHLSACDDIINMNKSIIVLDGRDFQEMFETIDQVHGNSNDLACGCTLQHFFDHHLRDKPNEQGQYWHYPLATCARHAPLVQDFIAHYAAAISEEMERNRLLWRRTGLRVISFFGERVKDSALRKLGIRTDIYKLAA